MSTWVGIDVGGTFTDVVVYADDGGRMVTTKVQSTPEDPSIAFMKGLQAGLQKAGSVPQEVSRLVHGSTVGINAFLQRRGARVGIICTTGFADTLAIGRAKRKQMYDFRLDYQTPIFLAQRQDTVEIATRLNPQGQLTATSSQSEIDQAVDYLVNDQGVDSIALNLLFSYTAPKVEQDIAARINARYPHVYVSCSSVIDPRVREYERLVVTALDAYIRPMVSRYIHNLRAKLTDFGVHQPLYMMESHGGIINAELLEDTAVTVLMSGLAGGAIGAAKVGGILGEKNLLSVDMGGTSTDVILTDNGATALSDEGAVGGFDVRLPIVDVHTVGAGGGSIGKLDISGGLKVGPESAGAVPGPVCYAHGGKVPTVTDANVVLGYLPNAELADGSMSLSRDLAEEAISKHIGAPLGKTPAEAAWAIHRVAVAGMANAARVVSIKRGIDVRDYALFPCGGAGPMHACGIAEELGIDTIIIPPFPGVLSAYGLLASDTVTNVWKTWHTALVRDGLKLLHAELSKATSEAQSQTDGKASDFAEVVTAVTLNMRYLGQSHELDLSIDIDRLLDAEAPASLRSDFDAMHFDRYGQLDDRSECEITGYKVAVTGYRPVPPPTGDSFGNNAATETTAPFWDPTTSKYVEARILSRSAFTEPIAGPAVIEQADTTIVVQSGWEALPIKHGSIKISKIAVSSPLKGEAEATGEIHTIAEEHQLL